MAYIEDNLPIEYPKGTSLKDRREVRKLIVACAKAIVEYDTVIISCSGGIDSTVLTHAIGQALRIRPLNVSGKKIKAFAVYVNHNLRSEEVLTEAKYVEAISSQYLGRSLPPIELDVDYGPGIQERARKARYGALTNLVNEQDGKVALLMGHNKNDQAETRLMQFLKGKPALGIPVSRKFTDNCQLIRPLLTFTREDIKLYAKVFLLTWCEDSSNNTDNYTRNKIRHNLLPWIEEHINPGVIDTLGVVE